LAKQWASLEHLPYVTQSSFVEPRESARLAQRALNGDAEAFEEIVLSHDPMLVRACFVITGDPTLARDAVQSCWQVAWAKRDHVRHPERFRAWLLAVACNEARMLVRKRARASRQEQPLQAASGLIEPLRNADVDLERALAGLKSSDRELVALRYGAGLHIDEIAEHFRISPAGARTRLFRTLARLRRELQ
jgi:RNA polymerase sigma-70 factor (ECF subfamily)